MKNNKKEEIFINENLEMDKDSEIKAIDYMVRILCSEGGFKGFFKDRSNKFTKEDVEYFKNWVLERKEKIEARLDELIALERSGVCH